MGRIAGDDPGYTFRICRYEEVPLDLNDLSDTLAGRKHRVWTPTEYGFTFVSVSTFIGEVLAKPASAMAWWGFRIGLAGVTDAYLNSEDPDLPLADADMLEEFVRARGVDPNMKLETAGARGSEAHGVLELLAARDDGDALDAAKRETEEFGTEYGTAVISWWNEQIRPFLETGQILQVRSEVPVWSFTHRYAGTFDLAIEWDKMLHADATGPWWEIIDLKTHKPAAGFTRPGKGPGYISDATQIRGYRMAFEEMGLGRTFSQRTVVVRDRAYKGVSWLEDTRTVPPEFVIKLRELYDVKVAFEKGEQ
jgi:hypothetical protein